MDKRSLDPALRAHQKGAEAMAVINSWGKHLGDGVTSSDTCTSREQHDAGRSNQDKRGPAGGPRCSASKQRDWSQTPDCSSNNSNGGNGRQGRSRSKPRCGDGKGGGNRHWETMRRTGSVSRACSKPRTGSSCPASSSSRAGSKPRNESTEHREIAEKYGLNQQVYRRVKQ
ncbi:hypothetical protein MRX96_019689 [Rhipicephalus microplus]